MDSDDSFNTFFREFSNEENNEIDKCDCCGELSEDVSFNSTRNRNLCGFCESCTKYLPCKKSKKYQEMIKCDKKTCY